ncbi:PKD domain-containing protein, partial [Cellulophaga baltica]
SGTNISLTLPAGTDVTALSPSITHTGASINPTSGVAQDFTSPVSYTVTAADGTTQVYSVTVTAPALSSTKAITAFTIGTVNGIITGTNISLTLPAGTDVTSLIPNVIYTGISVSPLNNVAQNFTNPVVYTITAADASTQEYTVTVIVPAANQAPTAVATSVQRTGISQYIFDFAGDSSSDPDSNPITYLWDFGDGGSSTEVNPNHTYTTTGVYNASLTVSDGSLTNTSSFTVNARDFVIFTEGSNISDTFGTGSISVTGDLIITGSPTIFTLAATLITGVGANSNATFIIGSTQYNANTSNTSVPGLRNTISYSSGIYTYTLSVINTSGNSGIIRAVVTYP